MSSERRIRASQTNGAFSKGPKTPTGRRRAAKNKIRHGILAQTIVLPGEDQSAFLEMLASFEAEYNPQTPSDTVLVEHLAASTWRLMRIWGIEKAGLVLEINKLDPATHDPATRASMAFKTLSDDSSYLELLHRYETRYDRQYARAYKLLNSRPSNLPCEPNPNNGTPPPDGKIDNIDQNRQNRGHSGQASTPPQPLTTPGVSPIFPPPQSNLTNPLPINEIGNTPGSSPHHPQPSTTTDGSPILPKMRRNEYSQLPTRRLSKRASSASGRCIRRDSTGSLLESCALSLN